MLITVKTTDTNLMEELKLNFPIKYDRIIDRRLFNKVVLNNRSSSIRVHLEITDNIVTEASVGDWLLLEPRRSVEFLLKDFERIHAIAEWWDNSDFEIVLVRDEFDDSL